MTSASTLRRCRPGEEADGFVLFLEGGHVAHLTVNGSAFPYIPQWIVIFILILMFSVDLYQNWLDRKRTTAPVHLHHRKK